MTHRSPTHFRTYIFSCVFVVSLGITHSTLAEGAPTYDAFTNLLDSDGGEAWGGLIVLSPTGGSYFNGGGTATDASDKAEANEGAIAFLNIGNNPADGSGGLRIYVKDSDITNLTFGGASYTEGTLLTQFDIANEVVGTDFCFNYGGSADVTCITLSKSANSDRGALSGTASQTSSSNTAPTADAGSDQTVASATSVTLDGTSSSDADSDALTYTWSQTSGTSVTLSSTTAAQPTFTAPTLAVGDADAVLVFSLTVNDGTVNSSADTVTITVEAPSPTPATTPVPTLSSPLLALLALLIYSLGWRVCRMYQHP